MRNVQLMENNIVEKCPKCGNNTEFEAYSAQVSEDCCEVWVDCVCGFDPTANNPEYRLEDVWGRVDNGNVRMALDCWNDAINEADSTTRLNED